MTTHLWARRLEAAAELGRGLISGLSRGGLLIVDAELRVFIAAGDAYASIDRATLIGRLVPDVIPADAWSVLGPHYIAALEGFDQAFDYAAVSEPSTHRLRMAPIREGDEVIGILVLAEDITAKASADARLADNERLQRSVLDVLAEGVVVTDPQRCLLQANPAALSILSLDLAAARADPSWWRPYAWRRPGDGGAVDVAATVLATGEAVRDVEVEADLPDGTQILLTVNFQPLRDEAGTINGLVLSFADITARRRAHRELVASQERLREAHDVANLASWEWDPATDEVLVFQPLVGETFAVDARVRLDDILVDMPPDDRRVARSDLVSVASGERETSVRLALWRRSTGPGWMETRLRAVRDGSGTVRSVRGTSLDVTTQETAKRQAAGSRDFFQATLDSLSAHIAVLDDRGEIIMTNRAWTAFGAAAGPATIEGNYLTVCDASVGEPDAARVATALRAIIAGEQSEFMLEYPCFTPTEDAWFALRAVGFEGAGASVVVSHENVTARRRAEAQNATQAALLDEVDVAVVASDDEGRVTEWNRGAERLYGWTAAEMVGRDAGMILNPSGNDEIRSYVADLRRDGRAEHSLTLRHKDGTTFPASVHGRLMLDELGQPAGRINVSVDMSERVAFERALSAGRNYMSALADSMGEGLFTLDPEGRLSYMNAVAERQLGWSPEELRGRHMHDVVHVPPVGVPTAARASSFMRAHRENRTVRVEEDHFARRDGRDLPVAYTASPFETEDGVKGVVVVFEDISERIARDEELRREADKLTWIGRIQDALAEDRFVLYAQPIIDVRDGAVVQSELLLRLRQPDGEIVGPNAYLKIAEQYGLIGQIDRWVIAHGIDIAASGVPVQINLSAQSVGDQDVLDHIEKCLSRSGADPSTIVFEITETAILGDETAARVFTQRLRALGCELALDDFGTGYGGFTYLKQIPVDFLKIDIEFVRDLATNPASRHVVEAVVGLARGFALRTVAEGVEDAATLDLLAKLGVDCAQGYHIARPKPLAPLTQEHAP